MENELDRRMILAGILALPGAGAAFTTTEALAAVPLVEGARDGERNNGAYYFQECWG